MHPLLTEYLAAERVRDMRASAKASRRVQRVRRDRHQSTVLTTVPPVTAAVRPGRPAWAGRAAAYRRLNSIEHAFEPAYPGRVAAYLPPGWPAGVHPPGSDGFEQTAVTWLLDVLPADYRVHGVLRRHPVALAAVARHYLDACVAGARSGYRGARTELSGALPPQAV